MKLYKYYGMSGLNLTSLINQQFWASKPGYFNDPYDTPVNWLKISRGKTMRLTHVVDNEGRMRGSITWDSPVPFEEAEIDKIKNQGIICFSIRKDNMLLWSHYADQHQGYALEFEVNDETLNYGLSPKLTTVIYGSTDINITVFNSISEVARHKQKVWEYEEEVRLLTAQGNKLFSWCDLHINTIKGKVDIFCSLTGIIFGSRANESTINAIKKIGLSINPDIKFMKAELSEEIFKLDIKEHN